MSASAKARARKEYVLSGTFGPGEVEFEEFTELRADRFERKGASRKHRKIPEDVVISHVRGNDEQHQDVGPVMLGSIQSDKIRAFHNLEAYPYAFESDLDVVQWACGMAGESPAARLLLKEAQAEGWSIRLDDLAQAGYAIDEENRLILLDHFGFTANALGRSSYFRNALFVHFIKALREVWHERQDHSFDATHRPESILLLERARAADCDTIAILCGWELRGAGYTDIWRAILGSDEGDMAMIFTRAIEKDPAGFYDGSVLTRTFCQWYGDEGRVASCDHRTLERLDEAVAEADGAEVFGSNPMRATDIEKISRLPGGRAYLTGMGGNICTDPYFVSLDDPINESHLFQIVYDSKVVMVEGVPFRDRRLARLIFPGVPVKVTE